ncbi:gliding motility protein GldM [Flavobacterium akiainvivens]|uniref:Gliding motility protein GldM n=1 Tax=Flavobacterium akiainvivens TaxID=1202724 RepID=A0A0M8MFF8_9FLAO|nr:gliding motility protein GldM [Flavobacterium akiainvivens]KOS07794.1 gliding motility protein GldM [Flavobacterium akiainvivens]SFQ26480.1 protein involved in gliding motility GldM [Flavobacterium akiainvivens]
MAGGKLTPRQKMVNLMYLVFIAMMALNMSKEVLSAFGLMNEKFESSNKDAQSNNEALYATLASKAGENAAQYGEAKKVADQVQKVSADFYAYIESLKVDITKEIEKVDGKLPYEAMDKGDKIDETWFSGDGYSKKGQEVVAAIDKYRTEMAALLAGNPKFVSVIRDVNAKFATADVKDREGVTKKFLDYHYKGFPAIASLTKLSAMQNDVETIEAAIYSAALGKAAEDAASYSNYAAIVVLDKNAYFQGEAVTGKVVLGRYDAKTVPTSVSVNGGSVSMENGQAVLKIGAGSIGEHEINGNFVFKESGKDITIPIKGQYVVVPQPKDATISADKMNSVYRGVDNPMTVSFAGVSANDVSATAPGAWKKSGDGKYNWNVTSVSGDKAKISVTAKLPGGKTATSVKEFNVRPIPAPVAELRGKINSGKGNKNDLLNSTIRVAFPDFVFDVKTQVTSFELSVPGSSTLVVQGDKFNGAAQALINKAKRGDVITINNVKCTLIGVPGYTVKGSAPFAWEVQ